MSFTPHSGPDDRSVGEKIGPWLEDLGRWVFGLGMLLTLAAAGLAVYTFQAAAYTVPPNPAQVLSNLRLYNTGMVIGVVLLAGGSAAVWWGEEVLAACQLIGAALFYFSPLFLPSVFPVPSPNEITASSLQVLQNGGAVFGIIALIVTCIDVAGRVKSRSLVGAKAEQLKIGKGLKEEKDIQNTFMGKCWQLPYCRKFVREVCPIYHAKRTCWKERVGCMCEEEVIRRAMERTAVTKDELAAAQYIPRNHRLSESAKAERCRSCVIYNERQKHKYRLILPLVVALMGALYVVGRPALVAFTGGMVSRVDQVVSTALMRQDATQIAETARKSIIPLDELLLGCFFILVFVYALKFVEFCIFKLKI